MSLAGSSSSNQSISEIFLKFSNSVRSFEIQVFCRPEWTKGSTLPKENFTIFKCKNEFSKSERSKNVWKKRNNSIDFHVSFLLNYGPENVKNCVFLSFFCSCQQKIKAVITIYVYLSESLVSLL